MLKELSYEVKKYMYNAVLENGVSITAYEDGTATGNDGLNYRLISHLDENDEVITDGWEAQPATQHNKR